MFKRTCRALPFVVLAALSPDIFAQQLAVNGQLDITPSGAAQFTVPIKIPAGVAGLQPEIKLVYNSHKADDWQGPYWSVSGFSMITRCKKNVPQNGVQESPQYGSADAFCLDGEQLVVVAGAYGANGSEYRTLHDNYSKITLESSFATSSFTVKTKAGLTMVYGGTDNSKLNTFFSYATQQTTLWGLSKVSDRTGNFMSYTYTNVNPSVLFTNDADNGFFRPATISYTENYNPAIGTVKAANMIRFEWDFDASHFAPKYSNGAALPKAGTIKKITIYVNGISTTAYSLEDTQISPTQKSTAIQECNTKDYSCLPPVKFLFETDPNGFQFYTGASAFPGTQTDYQYFFADLNGDGRKFWIQISQAADDAWIGLSKPDATFTAANWTKLTQSVGSLNNYTHTFADVNGDGKADWIRVSRTTNEAWVALGTGNGNFQFWTKYITTTGSANANKHYFADINGDGRVDWVQINNATNTMSVAMGNGDGSFQFWNTTKVIANLNQFDVTFTDINGDGKADFVYSYRSGLYVIGATTEYTIGTVQFSVGDGTFKPADYSWGQNQPGNYIPLGSKYAYADLNGDGQMDVIARLPDGQTRYALSKGNGQITNWYSGPSFGDSPLLLGDVSGNGYASILNMSGSQWLGYMTLANGNNAYYYKPLDVYYYDQSNQLGLGAGVTLSYYLADLNGDGKADLIYVNNVTKKAFVAKSQFNTFPKLVSISTDQSTPITISYAPIWDNTVVTPDTDAVYPMSNSVMSLLVSQPKPHVVASISLPNGIGGTLHTNYTYGGFRADSSRRQIQGFRWFNINQTESGISTRSSYLQNWPFTGLIADTKKTITSGGNGGLLTQTTNTYTNTCTTPAQVTGCTVAAGNRYATMLNQSVTTSWDLNGAVLPSITNSSQYDAFGNPTQVVNSISGGASITTVTTYNNDPAKWWINQPIRTTVTKVTP